MTSAAYNDTQINEQIMNLKRGRVMRSFRGIQRQIGFCGVIAIFIGSVFEARAQAVSIDDLAKSYEQMIRVPNNQSSRWRQNETGYRMIVDRHSEQADQLDQRLSETQGSLDRAQEGVRAAQSQYDQVYQANASSRGSWWSRNMPSWLGGANQFTKEAQRSANDAIGGARSQLDRAESGLAAAEKDHGRLLRDKEKLDRVTEKRDQAYERVQNREVKKDVDRYKDELEKIKGDLSKSKLDTKITEVNSKIAGMKNSAQVKRFALDHIASRFDDALIGNYMQDKMEGLMGSAQMCNAVKACPDTDRPNLDGLFGKGKAAGEAKPASAAH